MYLEPQCQQVDRMFAELSQRMDTKTLKLGTSRLLEKVLRTAFKGSIPRTTASTKNTEREHVLRNYITQHNKALGGQETSKVRKVVFPISTRRPPSEVDNVRDPQRPMSPHGSQWKFHQAKLQPKPEQLELGEKGHRRYLKYAQRMSRRHPNQYPE